jgi:hypothetical protein
MIYKVLVVGLSVVALVVLVGLALRHRHDWPTRQCDLACNTAMCACVRTCPSHRGE